MNLYHHKVQYYETDKMGIVHHSNYIRWMEEARVDFLEQLGIGFDKLEAMGIISPVVAVEGRYRYVTTFPESITISVVIEEFKGVKLKLKYTMTNAGQTVVFEGYSEHCFQNRNGKIINLKKEFPEVFSQLTEQ
ncbi:MAG: acyl-CoA thioesterase [Lachnospiraceae bacterium]